LEGKVIIAGIPIAETRLRDEVTMTHIDQTRNYIDRLNDFGPELGRFLGSVWFWRATINLLDFNKGTDQIYRMYSGNSPDLSYDPERLGKFINDLLDLAGRYPIHPQVSPEALKPLRRLRTGELAVYGPALWNDFFHVMSTPDRTPDIRSRVYVHASSASTSIEIMKLFVRQFGVNGGLREVKTAGPGSQRKDTIVAYFHNTKARNDLVTWLKQEAAGHESWFADSLPPLVKKEARGIGTADEPPAVEIFAGKGTRHSFGTFYSALIWVALRNTPNVRRATVDGRHMLDNLLFSLRVLRVDPRNPQGFPEASALEQWYQTSVVLSRGRA
jgi:hypothetical protein